MTDKKDYKEISYQLAERLLFALNHWKYNGGVVYNRDKGLAITPMRYFADGLKMLGYEIADADVEALALPAAARRKYFIAKEKAMRVPANTPHITEKV